MSTNQKKLLAGVSILMVMVTAAILYYFSKTNTAQSMPVAASGSQVSDVSVQVPVHMILAPQDLAIAKRRGVCRTMNAHLVTYATTTDTTTAQASYKAMGSLASEMLNYYAYNDSSDASVQSQTLASPKIWLDKVQFSEARQTLLDALETNRNQSNHQMAAENIKQACESCHQQFLKASL